MRARPLLSLSLAAALSFRFEAEFTKEKYESTAAQSSRLRGFAARIS
jgi:hypothetical protein